MDLLSQFDIDHPLHQFILPIRRPQYIYFSLKSMFTIQMSKWKGRRGKIWQLFHDGGKNEAGEILQLLFDCGKTSKKPVFDQFLRFLSTSTFQSIVHYAKRLDVVGGKVRAICTTELLKVPAGCQFSTEFNRMRCKPQIYTDINQIYTNIHRYQSNIHRYKSNIHRYQSNIPFFHFNWIKHQLWEQTEQLTLSLSVDWSLMDMTWGTLLTLFLNKSKHTTDSFSHVFVILLKPAYLNNTSVPVYTLRKLVLKRDLFVVSKFVQMLATSHFEFKSATSNIEEHSPKSWNCTFSKDHLPLLLLGDHLLLHSTLFIRKS